MTVKELSRSQLAELKQNYLCQTQENVSYGELVNADSIPDEVIFKEYDGYFFNADDFFVSRECILNFEIRCFERELVIKLHNENDFARAEKLMEIAYDKWCDSVKEVGDSCCEEYICEYLKINGVNFDWINEPINFENLREKLNSGKTLEEILKNYPYHLVECDGNEVYYDADFEEFLEDICAKVDYFGVGYVVISTENANFYELPFEERENRFDRSLEDELVLCFEANKIDDISELYTQKEEALW